MCGESEDAAGRKVACNGRIPVFTEWVVISDWHVP